jgi:elongation factor 3
LVGELPYQPQDLHFESVLLLSTLRIFTNIYTPVIVSHDSSFLNNTITDVLHLNRFKLRRYRGNLEKFVQQVPEAKSYYTLEAAEDYKFKLPDPPLLEGVKTKEKSLLKM